MRRIALWLVTVSALLAGALPAMAGDTAKPTVQTRLKRVALFKNGFGFFVREGKLSEANEVVLLGPFAAPSHGTFWITAPSRARLANVVARRASAQEEAPALSMVDLLKANVGRTVTVWTASQPESGITGTILGFPPESAQPRPELHAMLDESSIWPRPESAGFMLVQTGEGVLALDPRTVSRLSFDEGPKTTLARETTGLEIEATFESPSPGDWLSVSYVARGISWAPSYMVDISTPDKASLTAKAEIINEAEDLEETHVDLVTGFPNLQFADVLSPMTMKESLGQFLQSLARGSSRFEAASVMTQSVAYNTAMGISRRGESWPAGPVPEYGASAAGQATGDLFFYPIEKVTLKRNETGYYPLFTESVPWAEFYEWSIPDYVTQEGRYEERPTTNEVVWHNIRLTNTTAMPWTSAPVQVMENGQIMAQDTLKYTAPKAETVVKITQAVGVKAEQGEVVTSRQREAVEMYGSHFDLVSIKGTMKVTNYTDEPVSMEVTKTLSGDVKATTPKAKDVILARNLNAINSVHELTWKIEVKAGDSKELTYSYQALIRR
ncbi:MAG: hypothetical protein ACE149_13480 [Armatimonadota bacterium]